MLEMMWQDQNCCISLRVRRNKAGLDATSGQDDFDYFEYDKLRDLLKSVPLSDCFNVPYLR